MHSKINVKAVGVGTHFRLHFSLLLVLIPAFPSVHLSICISDVYLFVYIRLQEQGKEMERRV